jgi:Ca-activated chloride channel family protein
MIRFDHPILLLSCLAPLLLAGVSRFRKVSSGIPLPLDIWGSRPAAGAGLTVRIWYGLSQVGFAVAWMALSVAAAGPVRLEPDQYAGLSEYDVIYVLDVSPSMAVMDMAPNRLEAALEVIRTNIAASAANASAGVVVFGARAMLLCPPTPDQRVLLERLDAVRAGMLGDGTAIGQGLAAAQRHLATARGRFKLAVLLTDGEDNAGGIHPLDAAAGFGASGYGFLVVGIGSSGEAPMDYTDPVSGERLIGAYRSTFDDRALQAIAVAGGGMYTRAIDAAAIMKAINRASSQFQEAASADTPAKAAVRPVRIAMGKEVAALAALALVFAWFVRMVILGGLA